MKEQFQFSSETVITPAAQKYLKRGRGSKLVAVTVPILSELLPEPDIEKSEWAKRSRMLFEEHTAEIREILSENVNEKKLDLASAWLMRTISFRAPACVILQLDGRYDVERIDIETFTQRVK